MKLLISLAAVAGLSGCVAYPYGYYGEQPYYGGGAYYGGSVVVQQRPARVYGPPRSYRDRDGDGVPNRYDARPDNPRRY
jgi:hypothetical protein